ncbi:uncharacterized protein LOC129566204 [Sitodiplosis mosellana]|uniref:uncharacterized protein LOC129566204 n=1 Tax=Sitodiplosis mosellana TaxID=263140 RepID=UPI002443A2BA|nr:uncharacterized protein LOC129566204 [Sitodiplosis mosellana]
MASQPQHKYDNFQRFVFECKKYVSEIQNYSGGDRLAPWYAYLLWMEENFIIDLKGKETIFDEILAACLCQFENDALYKQDRRLIKLFIKFIQCQEEQDMHYDAMVSNAVGDKVADLYINWAFHFDIAGQFIKADEVFRRGLNAGAEPLNLLKSAHQAFGYSMSQRMLYKSDTNFQQQLQCRMKKQLEDIASLRIDGTSVNAAKSMALQMFDKSQLMSVCIPNCEMGKTTPEKRHNTSVAQNIIDSARKMRREKSNKLIKKACRLDFNENACAQATTARLEPNMYERGIQLGQNFKSKNLPQRQVPPTPYNDPSIGTFRGELPRYDKIMLVPGTNMAFSADELKAYKWFKQRRIENTFTKEQDKIWGVGHNLPIRWANVFARKNYPQPKWIVPRIEPSDELNERGPHRFMCRMANMYPENSSEEYSLDEIMWNKRRAKANAPPQPANKSVMKSNRLINRTNSNDSKLSPIVEMELSGYGDALLEVPRRKEIIQPNTNTVEWNKKRKSSIFPTFDALNDTCTTQMFSNLLHSSAISTPKVKMPRFDRDETVSSHWQEETKLKLFTDQSSELLPDLNNQGDKNGKSQPNDVGFAIYEDKTLTMHAVKSAAYKQTINESSVGNKENIAVNENQLVNLEPIKTTGKFESAVINSSEQPSMKVAKEKTEVQQSNGLKFDVYTDNTETMVNVWQNVQKLETSIENKENQIQQPKQDTTIEDTIANVNKMIESVLNATKPDGFNATKHATTNSNATNYLNATRNLKDESAFKAPLPPKKTKPAQRPSDTFFELLDTTEEFEFLEAQCANSPNTGDKSLELPSFKLEQSFAKSVTIGAANKSNLTDKSFRLSIEITEEERLNVINNPAICDKTRLNWTQQLSMALPNEPPIVEHEVEEELGKELEKEAEMKAEETEEEDDIGRSIYVKQPEPEFNEKDADWKEYTQFIANNTAINEYIVEEVNLDETKHRIDTHMLNLKDLNPFDPEVQKDVLTDIGFLDQLSGANNFNCVMMNVVPPLKPRASIEINKQKYQIRKLIGTGTYGKVFSAECSKTKEMYALKQQRPPNLWEYYVCLQIHARLKDERVRNGFMAVDLAFIGNNATIFASKFSKHGTILNVCNKVKQTTNKPIEECIVMILVKQMFTIMEHFHRANFIHADIKPDNFLLMDKLSLNYENPDIVLQLIDFGQSIDLSYFSNHVFWAKVKTENFVCTQMMEDKPWTYHCDLFCLASTIYTMVAGKYMVVSRCKPTDPYKPQKLPRYVNGSLWDEIFDTLINIRSMKKMPSWSKLQQLLDNELQAIGKKKVTEAIAKFNKALD